MAPTPAMTLDAFRAWVASDDYPETGKVTFYDGRMFFDRNPQKYYTHLAIRDAINKSTGILIDTRGEEIDFKLLVAGRDGCEETPADRDVWRRSSVFEREFHLSRDRDRVNRWRYKLAPR